MAGRQDEHHPHRASGQTVAPCAPASAAGNATSPRAAGIERERLAAIARITRRTVGSVPLKEHAQEMAEQVRSVFRMDACVIRLLRGENLELLAAAGLPPESRHANVPIGWGITQQIMQLRRPVFIPDVMQQPEIAAVRNRIPNAYEFTSYAGAPMTAGDHVFGLLGIFSVRRRDDLTEADLDCLQVLANSLSVAIANDELYEHAQRAEEEARAQRLMLENVANSLARGAVYQVIRAPDGSERMPYISAGIQRLLGIPAAALMESVQPLYEVLMPEDLAGVRQAVEESSRKLTHLDLEARFRCDDGRICTLHFRSNPSRLPDGSTLWNGVVLDVTERRQMESESLRLREELARVGRVASMGELTATIAHEVNQPLGAIVANAQACQRMLAAPEPNLREVQAALADIVSDGGRAGKVIARVRDFLRNRPIHAEPVRLNDVVGDVLRTLQDRFADEFIRTDIDLAADLPLVLGDRSQLRQVVVNLLYNAADALAEVESSRRRLIIRSRRAGDRVVLLVEDTGPGISPEALPEIFRPFYSTKPDGMGMGLAISRSLVEAHGGALTAESRPDGGAMFECSLPIYLEAAR